jgi:hypothetical protein
MREKPRAKRGYSLSVAMLIGLGVIGLIFLSAAVAGETPPTQAPQALGNELILLSKFQPWMIMVMVLGVLAALIISLLMIYMYIARVRTTEFHRQMLLDAVTAFQYQKLMAGSDELRDRLTKMISTVHYDLVETPTQTTEREKREQEEEAEHERKSKELEQQHRVTARHDAEILVPPTLSVAGMGITGAFFIELTAILTIIFGILILGLLGVLGTREISPILAAIAGYVLGKTTSGQPSQANSPTPQTAGGQIQQSPTPRL